jgi:hypothetical protein
MPGRMLSTLLLSPEDDIHHLLRGRGLGREHVSDHFEVSGEKCGSDRLVNLAKDELHVNPVGYRYRAKPKTTF